MYYILDSEKAIEKVPQIVWARWFGAAERVVEKTIIGDAEISTVFLGIDHQFGEGPPLLFETLIFGGEHDGDMWRYPTWGEAKTGHDEVVANLSITV